jgi:hypothetical protein
MIRQFGPDRTGDFKTARAPAEDDLPAFQAANAGCSNDMVTFAASHQKTLPPIRQFWVKDRRIKIILTTAD